MYCIASKRFQYHTGRLNNEFVKLMTYFSMQRDIDPLQLLMKIFYFSISSHLSDAVNNLQVTYGQTTPLGLKPIKKKII